MLDVRRLRVLREVAERGSFSAAADALSFTQSAVSQQIAALERETGTTLLQRGPGGIRLTDAGRALVAHTEAVLERLADAERELAAIAGLRGGRVRLASFPTAGATLVPNAVSVFTERYPDVELTLTEAEPEDSLPRLRRGDFEVALIYDYGLDDSHTEGVELVHLLDDPLYLVLPVDHPLAQRRSIRIEELADEPWVSGCRDGHCHEMLMRTCEDAGFEPRLAFFTNDTQVQIALVAAGVGVTLAPELGLRNAAQDIAVRAVAPQEPARQVLAAVPSADYRSAATEAMIAVLKEVAADFPPAAELYAKGDGPKR
jgi:molybdate transport repressor ModE-like protein